MKEEVTLDMILELPKKILEKAEQYGDYSELLPKEVYEKYDLVEVRSDVSRIFKHFNVIKYLYSYSSEEYNIKITPTYEPREGTISNKISDSVGDMVTKKVDNQIWIVKFYNSIMNVALKMTDKEAFYIVCTYFANKSEEYVSDRLGICRNTLQKIKKSSLVKTWVELHELD